MRFLAIVPAVALAAIACGPSSPTTYARADRESRIMRPPPNAPPDPIGTVRPGDRSCTENRDCKPGETCVAPDFAPAASPPCTTDGDCPTGQLCSGASCASPCTPDSCGPGKDCRDGRCIALSCASPGAPVCPQNFRCNPSSGTCDRQPCTSRSQCDVGVCYQSRCFSHDAFCRAP